MKRVLGRLCVESFNKVKFQIRYNGIFLELPEPHAVPEAGLCS